VQSAAKLSQPDALAMNVIEAKNTGLAPPEAETIEERILEANGPPTVSRPWGGSARRRSEMTG
jgi:hypothetical protein